MSNYYDAIYLSPHLDDAALSCGGQIYQQTEAGKSVLVVTMTAGDPPAGGFSLLADELHGRWRLSTDVVASRRREDAAACNILGAEYVHWDFLDCIYRRHPGSGQLLYTAEEQIFGHLHPAETALVDRVAGRIARLPEHETIYLPLTVGRHVDHQLLLAAARELQQAESTRYYEDFPYVCAAGALAAALGDEADWEQQAMPLSPAALEARIEAIASYRSQIDILFGGLDQLRHEVVSQVTATGGERYWRKFSVNSR